MDYVVLANAAKQAADFLDINLDQLYDSHSHLEMHRHEIEMILVKDIYKPLFNIMGGHKAEMRNWMKSDNSHLQGVPKDLMMSSGGLNNISIYLRSFR